MIDKLMERYDALGCISDYPFDYAEQWERLAIDFAVDGRYAMSAKCRERAKHYSQLRVCGKPMRITGKMIIQKSKSKVLYIEAM